MDRDVRDDGANRFQDLHRLFLVDELALRRAGVKSLLDAWAREDHFQLEVIETDRYDSGPLDAAARLAIFNAGSDLIFNSPLREQLHGLRRALPSVPLVVFSDREEVGDVMEAVEAGASGFVCASTPPSIVFQALRFVMGGGRYFPSSALLGARDMPRHVGAAGLGDVGEGAGRAHLTARQSAVFRLLREGYSNKRIARELAMRESTAKVHVRQIMRKLGASNRTQVALYGLRDSEETTSPRSG